MSTRVVAWNMHQDAANWRRLEIWEAISGASAYLLCEARADPPTVVEEDLHPLMHGSTKETKCPCEPGPDGRPKCDKRRYSTAVAAPGGVRDLNLGPSERVGTWIAGAVLLGSLPVTAIAVYGLGDSGFATYWESTKAAVDEVVSILDEPQVSEHVLIGADFNILAGKSRYGGHEVLDGLKGLGFVECLEAGLTCEGHVDGRSPADLAACDCGRGPICTHTRTFYSPKDPGIPHQDDYLFVSKELARYLVDCWAPPVGPGAPSDHAPIIAEFDIPG